MKLVSRPKSVMVKFSLCCFKFEIHLKKRKKSPPNIEKIQQQGRKLPTIIVTQISESDSKSISGESNENRLRVSHNISPSYDSGLHSPIISPLSEPSTSIMSCDFETELPNISEDYSSEWIQVSGHKDSFKKPFDDKEVVLKTYSEAEMNCFYEIQNEKDLYSFVPKFYGVFWSREMKFIKMEDLLAKYVSPSIMDCKIGCRTYLQAELDMTNHNYRKDLYDKMVELCPDEPTPEENERRAVLKSRYMVFRESLSSSRTLSFRVEATKHTDEPKKIYPRARTFEQVKIILAGFIGSSRSLLEEYLSQITSLKDHLLKSDFFANHEVIGSSLLFVHESDHSNPIVRMIDFARVQPALNGPLSHSVLWETGSQEDGYLLGVDNIIKIIQSILTDISQ